MASVALIEMLIERMGRLEDMLRPVLEKPDYAQQFDNLKPGHLANMHEAYLKEQLVKKLHSMQSVSGYTYAVTTLGMCKVMKDNGFSVFSSKNDPYMTLIVAWGDQPDWDVLACGYENLRV